MQRVDFRSDTVTHPTPKMREAMASARVGDDVYGDDPTTNELEQLSAQLLGKEAAILVPSGTMGNLASVLAHCARGDEVIMGNQGHTFLYEAGGIAALGGVHPHTLPNQPDGTLDLAQVRTAIRDVDIHYPPTTLLILENTQNACGGVAIPPEYIDQAGELAHQNGMKLHIDGARLFNAAVKLGVAPADLVRNADSVTFCLSKSLCCPIGSIICGSETFITRVRRIRKMLGGGMRQTGIIAAAGIIALNEMIDRLAEDHQRARLLADGLSRIPAVNLLPGTPQTNMVYFNLTEDSPISGEQLTRALAAENILVGGHGTTFRLVTHYWIDDAAVERTIKLIGQFLTR
ncbi:MAG: low-specificity L-threonine aldolase [Anaerolineaceae bacterium]|nr:low-specificity L-threonine aldolase [Anaerolineaceae bacterium]